MAKYDKFFIKLAENYSELSFAKRKKVGAVIVKENSVISDGYNGTPSGYDNNCEDPHGNTFWYVLHAEANAILKTAKNNQNCKDSTLYVTMSPCKECAKLIIQSGIKKVIYRDLYRDTTGIDFLGTIGIECVKIDV